ncbi:MAG: 16S rRNA (cytosine(1402)-N(4))-methyltransferase RsmH [Acidobacteriota bacterium]|nr:16S rRNA (cytosine(1402)-N(4))-methyltransferase RsmH [Acidobacteriota bacterium]
MASEHLPVLTERVVEFLSPAAPGLLIDATVGLGGHAEALLRSEPGFRLLGLDRDPAALARAGKRLRDFSDRVRLEESSFDQLPAILERLQLEPPAAILADLGCSSLQLDTPERGFSFRAEGPLDMRMGATGQTAEELLASAEWKDLVKILREYGEERHARAISRAIVARRDDSPLRTTGDLSRLVRSVVGNGDRRIHPATRTFQALRIAVNDELGQLERFLEPATRALRPGGRIAVIAFHSLEDRIVKHTMRNLEGRCTCPPDFPVCRCDPDEVVRVVTRSPIRPDDDEVEGNPRARSARLRVAERRGRGAA